MTQPASRPLIAALALIALPLAAGEPARPSPKAEFQAQTRDYLESFQLAAQELQALIQAERIEAVAVAGFTDMTGGELYVGQLFAEELATLLVPARPAEPPKRGQRAPVRHRVLDPAATEEFVRAGGGGTLWSSTRKIREFGKSAEVALVVTGKIEISNREARFFLKAVATEDATIVWARTLSIPGVAAGTEVATAAVPETAPLAASTDAPPEPAATPVEPAPTQSAPTQAAPTQAAPTQAVPQVAPPQTAPAASAPSVAVAPPANPPEVLTFENGWLRAKIVSASKYTGSGWVTVVLDVSNLSDRPVFVDLAQDNPGRGVDESNNAWRVERVTGLRLAPAPNPGMTPLGARATVRVFIVLATTVNPSGTRLSFAPNLLWWGSNGAADNGRVALAFSNVRVD